MCTLDWSSQYPAQACLDNIYRHLVSYNFIGVDTETEKLNTLPGELRREVIAGLIENSRKEAEESREVVAMMV